MPPTYTPSIHQRSVKQIAKSHVLIAVKIENDMFQLDTQAVPCTKYYECVYLMQYNKKMLILLTKFLMFTVGFILF